MATDTKRCQVGLSSEILADVRNKQTPFLKNVFIFAHRYEVTTDYTATNDVVIQFDGAQKILFAQVKEVLAATNTNINCVEADISGRTGKQLTTAATNASSLALEVFAVVEV